MELRSYTIARIELIIEQPHRKYCSATLRKHYIGIEKTGEMDENNPLS